MSPLIDHLINDDFCQSEAASALRRPSLVSDNRSKHVRALWFQSLSPGSGTLVGFRGARGESVFCSVLLFKQSLPDMHHFAGYFYVVQKGNAPAYRARDSDQNRTRFLKVTATVKRSFFAHRVLDNMA